MFEEEGKYILFLAVRFVKVFHFTLQIINMIVNMISYHFN